VMMMRCVIFLAYDKFYIGFEVSVEKWMNPHTDVRKWMCVMAVMYIAIIWKI
jgi:hypothetical protein